MPLDFVSSVLVSTVLTGALSALAYRRDVLTWDGSLAAFVVGMVIGIFGDVTWLFLLLFFLLSSFLATRYRFALGPAVRNRGCRLHLDRRLVRPLEPRADVEPRPDDAVLASIRAHSDCDRVPRLST